MAYTVIQGDILSVPADAAVLALEMTGNISTAPSMQSLVQAGGDALRSALRGRKFLPVGSAAEAAAAGLPWPRLILTAEPRWLTGKANELLALHRCYESVYDLAERLGCRRLVMPFLSAEYYHFPRDEAVHAALTEAEKRALETVFVADTPELLALSRQSYRKPRIVSYVGWYRDDAYFALDNGQYARIDMRREVERCAVIPFIEACCRVGNNPRQKPLPEAEIARLRQIYENSEQ